MKVVTYVGDSGLEVTVITNDNDIDITEIQQALTLAFDSDLREINSSLVACDTSSCPGCKKPIKSSWRRADFRPHRDESFAYRMKG